MNEKISVLLFDMGRVLVKIDFDAFPNALGLQTIESREPYRQAAMKLEYLYECGKITTEEFLDSLYAAFGSRFSREQLLDAYNEIIVEENTGILPLVQKAKGKYRIAVLSNTSEAHWKKSLETAPMLQLFPETFTSFQIGAMKPKAIVYETVIASLGVPAPSILFIDDVQENIDGALACGMKGILYTTTADLEQKMNGMNIW
ncbi:MAG: HAD family phosphatase [Bacteroidota bacterium]|jgi:putative hydrolase of the HAD superfamily